MTTRLNERGINRSRQTGITVFAMLLTVAVVVVACSDVLVDSAQDMGEQAVGEQAATNEGSAGGETFVIVEQMPELIGGLASIQEQLRYPQVAREAGIEGRVIIQFIVDEEGRVVDPKVVRGMGSGLDEAALEAVRTAQFKPGEQRGEPVPVKMSLPVTFRLGEDAPPPSRRADGAGASAIDDDGLSETQASPLTAATASVIQLHIDANDRLYVNGSAVNLANLASALQTNGLSPETIVSLRVDADASMGAVSDVQTVLRNTDVQKISYQSERASGLR